MKNQFTPPLNLITLQTTKRCNLDCRYCYMDNASKRSSSLMDVDLVKKTLNELVAYHEANEISDVISIVFHGGETLLLGHHFFKQIFEFQLSIEDKLGKPKFRNSIQSNVTLLDNEYCKVFSQYNVGIGTSIDGPPHLHNLNRYPGVGPYDHQLILDKIQLAKDSGITIGAIALITKPALNMAEELFNFFDANSINFKVNKVFLSGEAYKHKDELEVNDDQYAEFLCHLFDLWYSAKPNIQIDNLMQFIGIILAPSKAGTCATSNCSYRHLTVTPTGDCYTCGRTTQNTGFLLGNISNQNFHEIATSSNLRYFLERNPSMIPECASCSINDVCFSGCMYEAYLKHNSIYAPDANCSTFKAIYSHVSHRVKTDLLQQHKEV